MILHYTSNAGIGWRCTECRQTWSGSRDHNCPGPDADDTRRTEPARPDAADAAQNPTSGDGRVPTPRQLDDLKAVGRHEVFRLPSGETRLYFQDGSYTSGAGGRFGELIEAGWVRIGPLFYAAPVRAQRNWRFLDLTGAGQRVIATRKG